MHSHQILFPLLVLMALLRSAVAQPLDSGIARRDVENRSYFSYAKEVVDNLLTFGTDRYGDVQSRLLVSNLDVRTKSNPPAGALGSADEFWRVERRQRRAPGGANYLHNQSVYAAIQQVGERTGDGAYVTFVHDSLNWAMENLVDENHLFWWGYHRHYDVHDDVMLGDPGDDAPHEMHFVDAPLWQTMWQQNASAVHLEFEAIWDRHVDASTGQINRHDEPGGLSFITSSASFIDAFAFASSVQTGPRRQQWLDRAKLLANYNFDRRHPSTNLIAHTTNEPTRWDGSRAVTTIPAVYVPGLLAAYDATGDDLFRHQAETLLQSWAEYAFDDASGSFWGSLELDGTPVPGPWARGGYDQFERGDSSTSGRPSSLQRSTPPMQPRRTRTHMPDLGMRTIS